MQSFTKGCASTCKKVTQRYLSASHMSRVSCECFRLKGMKSVEQTRKFSGDPSSSCGRGAASLHNPRASQQARKRLDFDRGAHA